MKVVCVPHTFSPVPENLGLYIRQIRLPLYSYGIDAIATISGYVPRKYLNEIDDDAKTTGILVWENSVFLLEYVEFTLAAGIYDYSDEGWLKTLLMKTSGGL